MFWPLIICFWDKDACFAWAGPFSGGCCFVRKAMTRAKVLRLISSTEENLQSAWNTPQREYMGQVHRLDCTPRLGLWPYCTWPEGGHSSCAAFISSVGGVCCFLYLCGLLSYSKNIHHTKEDLHMLLQTSNYLVQFLLSVFVSLWNL